MGWEVSVGSWGGSSSFGAALEGMGDGRRVCGSGDWRLDWRDGGVEGRDDMLSTAVVDDDYMFSARRSRNFGLRICLAV